MILLKHLNFWGNIWRTVPRVFACSFNSKILKLYEKVFQQRSLFKSCAQKYSWYYNKTINRGDTSDFIGNVENIFVCWDQILEGSVQNNF